MKVHLLESAEPLMQWKNLQMACGLVLPDSEAVAMAADTDIRLLIDMTRPCKKCHKAAGCVEVGEGDPLPERNMRDLKYLYALVPGQESEEA